MPPNLTSEVQPLDQGIIRTVKAHYKKKMLQHLVTIADSSIANNCSSTEEFHKSINVYQAVKWIKSSWDEVSAETISKCFKRSGFPDESAEDDIEGTNDNENQLETIIQSLPPEVRNDILSINEVMQVDSEADLHEETCSSMEEVLVAVLHGENSEEVEDCDSNSSFDAQVEAQAEVAAPLV